MAKTSISNDQEKLIAALAYLIFFLPLIVTPSSKFGKFHANQALVLLVLAIIIQVVGTVLPIIGWFIILPLGWLLTLVLFLIGFVNALGGKQKPLPLIGNFTLIS